MKKEYILFIDSGVGGLSTMAECHKLSNRNFIYFADNKNHPYGTKTAREIYLILKGIIDDVSHKFSIKTVVLACNTATTSAICNLRKTYKDINFIGTEPAIKLAIDSGSKRTLVLLTRTSSKQTKFRLLKKKLESSGVQIKTCAMVDLAQNIESSFVEGSFLSRLKLLKNLLEIRKKSKSYDSIVLGCTHYCLIKNLVSKFSNATIFDGNVGVAKNLSNENQIHLNGQAFPIFMFSNPTKILKQKYIKIFKQILANI